MKLILCVLFLCATTYGLAEEGVADESARIAFKLYNDCTNDVGFSVCLKKKAITFLDRLGRMENVSVATGINIVRKPTANNNESVLTENELEQNLPRALDAREDALSVMLLDKLFSYMGSRNVEVSLPKFEVQEFVEEGKYHANFVIPRLFLYFLIIYNCIRRILSEHKYILTSSNSFIILRVSYTIYSNTRHLFIH